MKENEMSGGRYAFRGYEKNSVVDNWLVKAAALLSLDTIVARDLTQSTYNNRCLISKPSKTNYKKE